MPEYYCFGIELEMVATPRNDSQATRFMREAGRDNLKYHLKYYDELATAMRLEGLEAIAVPRSRAPPRGWRGWHITSDGSILEDEDGEVLQPPIVPFEAVSGILETKGLWETEIESFWAAQQQVFYMPERSIKCGTHIHITPGSSREWSLERVKCIAIGVIRYEEHIQKMLPETRRSTGSDESSDGLSSDCDHDSESSHSHANRYLRRNSGSSDDLRSRFHGPMSGLASGLPRSLMIARVSYDINQLTDVEEIVEIMQRDRRVLWNFANLLESKNTIEFRGGRGLRGPQRTKWWIAFVVDFVDFLLEKVDTDHGDTRLEPTDANVKWLYTMVDSQAVANDCYALPPDYRNLNETMALASHEIEQSLDT